MGKRYRKETRRLQEKNWQDIKKWKLGSVNINILTLLYIQLFEEALVFHDIL